MENTDIYQDIEKRTNGDIYIGVVGPVRTGKSTFIKKFMELLVLPSLSDSAKERATDELPQSAEGKTVMTTEPKFVPAKAAEVNFSDGNTDVKAKVRLIDCVGFAVEGAFGFEENGEARLVNTPWSSSPLPFEKAAETGTRKVIREHSTIGILVTTDGSFTDIDRVNYIPAEERSVAELKAIGKPFIILLNATNPDSDSVRALRAQLEEKYSVSVIAANCKNLTVGDISYILRSVLLEFPVREVDFNIPDWMQVLERDSSLISDISARLERVAKNVVKMRDCALFERAFDDCENILPPVACNMSLGDGRAEIDLAARDGVFFKVLSEECAENIENNRSLMRYVKELSKSKKSYDKIRRAFEDAESGGYGMVSPFDDISIEQPEMIKQGNSLGIKIKASAPSYHIMKVDISSEFSPVIGPQSQSEDFIKGVIADFDSSPDKLLSISMFGKTLKELVSEGLSAKMSAMPASVQNKMRRAITRIINDGRGNIICFVF